MTTMRTFPNGPRPSTEAFHRRAVERAVLAMRQRFGDEELHLADLASAAVSSRFHFARLFREISGVPPCHFLTAVRMQAAKQLLAETALSVTDVCLAVGYSSTGTFTRRFRELVGLPPRAFRRLVHAPLPFGELVRRRRPVAVPRGATLFGSVIAPVARAIAIALFPTPLPQGRPVRWTVVDGPGPYRLHGVPDGEYFAFAATVDTEGGIAREPEFRSPGAQPVSFSAGRRQQGLDLALCPRDLLDPPVVLSVPLLVVAGVRGTPAAMELDDRVTEASLTA